jgi:hypothetical protein
MNTRDRSEFDPQPETIWPEAFWQFAASTVDMPTDLRDLPEPEGKTAEKPPVLDWYRQ